MDAQELVLSELQSIRLSKGLAPIHIDDKSILLGGELGLDSLDLATLVVTLEELTGMSPFSAGFVMFKTVGDLSALFSKS